LGETPCLLRLRLEENAIGYGLGKIGQMIEKYNPKIKSVRLASIRGLLQSFQKNVQGFLNETGKYG
jgi:hypothetical protein